MALIPSQLILGVVRRARRLVAQLVRPTLAAAALSVGSVGCVGLSPFLGGSGEAPRVAPARDMIVLWNRNVSYLPDPTRNGVPGPGVVGRLYLFGSEEGSTVAADGTIVVDMFDDTPRPGLPAANPNAPPTEEWHLDKATMTKLMKKDTVGWGYTLFLPWSTYRPDTTVVRLTARFEPANGGPAVNAPVSPVTLDHSQAPTVAQQTVPPLGALTRK